MSERRNCGECALFIKESTPQREREANEWLQYALDCVKGLLPNTESNREVLSRAREWEATRVNPGRRMCSRFEPSYSMMPCVEPNSFRRRNKIVLHVVKPPPIIMNPLDKLN